MSDSIRMATAPQSGVCRHAWFIRHSARVIRCSPRDTCQAYPLSPVKPIRYHLPSLAAVTRQGYPVLKPILAVAGSADGGCSLSIPQNHHTETQRHGEEERVIVRRIAVEQDVS